MKRLAFGWKMLTVASFQAGYSSHWCHVQLDPHLRKPGIPHIERFFHSDAQGTVFPIVSLRNGEEQCSNDRPLQATTAVAVLLATWAFGIAPPNMKVLGNVAIIVLGVVIASFGEIKFEFWGFVFQIGGIVTEALRLVMVQRLLSAGDFKMDPLVSLYYYAPACAVTNAVITLFVEGPRITMGDINAIGPFILLANALVAFFLNVSSVLLVSKSHYNSLNS